MNKHYSRRGKYAGSIHIVPDDNLPEVVWRSNHHGVCAGFSICVLPRRTGKKRYQIMKDGDSFGTDFALSEARKTIDRIINRGCFIAL